MKDNLSIENRIIVNQAQDLIEKGEPIDEIYKKFPDNIKILKKFLNIPNTMQCHNSRVTNLQNKRIFSDIIRRDKKNNSNKKIDKEDFLYKNNDNIYSFNSNRPQGSLNQSVENLEFEKGNNSNKFLFIRQLHKINYKLYIVLVSFIFIFYSINIFYNQNSTIEIDVITRELKNENEIFAEKINKLYQEQDDALELTKKFNQFFSEFAEPESIDSVDKLNIFEESSDINEIQK
ncbi:hypothetical protein K0B03_03425 [Patescibacteria group bacterium]|nr:hypothetical protein [Patescibacteria group bacterium]